MQTIAVAYILNSAQEVLCLKRSMMKKSNPGKWHTPAGKVEEGELPQECMERELREELGEMFRAAVSSHVTYVDHQPDGDYETHLFVMDYVGGEVILNVENDEVRWVHKDRLFELDVIPSIAEDLKHITL